jgi:hypothetical protein
VNSGPGGWNEPRLLDCSQLPKKLIDRTEAVKPEVRKYLAGRVGERLPDGTAWFQHGEKSLALIDLNGKPSSWSVKRTVKLPKGQIGAIRALAPGLLVVLKGVPDGVKDKQKQHIHLADTELQVLDLRNGATTWCPPVRVGAETRYLNVIGKYAYLPTVPKGCGNECIVSPIDGMHFRIYDLANPKRIRLVGKWAPAQPNRALLLYANPKRPRLVAVVEARMGFGIHFADFADPRRPKTLAGVPTNGGGSGDRVMVWGRRAFFTAGLNGIWYDISQPRAPKRLGEWFNHRWFRALHMFGDTALVAGYQPPALVVNFRDPKYPKVVARLPRVDAAWGPRVYAFQGQKLVTTDISDPAKPRVLGKARVKALAQLAGSWADGALLYAVAGGKKGGTLVIWDVADPAHVRELGRLTHPEITIGRGEGHWTAHGRVLCAARGIVLITSLHGGRPQVIDARNPRQPRFLKRLATAAEDATDGCPDGPYFHVKYWTGRGELWDLSVPEKPRRIWKEAVPRGSSTKSWVCGMPAGEVLLAPRPSYLKAVTVPRPSQVPAGKVTWR